MAKYRLKPIVIEAWQWDGKPLRFETTPGWLLKAKQDWPLPGGIKISACPGSTECSMVIMGSKREVTAWKGDWLVRGIAVRALFRIREDLFEFIYDKVEDEARETEVE